MTLKEFLLSKTNNNFLYSIFECSKKNVHHNKYLYSSNNKFLLEYPFLSSNHFLIFCKNCDYIEEYNSNGYFIKNYDKTYFLV